jgi:predicted CoA-substrate-specific enzyme activase
MIPRIESSDMKKAFGLCLGASTISAVEMSGDSHGSDITRVIVRPHGGNPQQVLIEVIGELACDAAPILVTGRKFRHNTRLPSETELEATERALHFISGGRRRFDAVLSAGGETFIVYALDQKQKIVHVSSGNKCASGTGEFFLQQIKRMNLGIREAVELAGQGMPYTLSGRCSVFCKSDCTHALNKGETIPNVTAGLCRMIAGKMEELLAPIPHGSVLVVGGTAENFVVIGYLRSRLLMSNPQASLTVPQEAPYFEALGAALLAFDRGVPPPAELFRLGRSSFTFLPPMREAARLVTFREMTYGSLKPGDDCVIGLDVGSTTTKAVLLRPIDSALLASEYLRTNGNPVEASRACLRTILKKVGLSELEVSGIGVTGSGRRIAGLYCLSDGIINEIIAHAAAAAYWDPEVDTIFEIGGQDAKYTHLQNGVASDYAMNEACSAGTGSFLEESAYESLGVRTEDIAQLALLAEKPPNFSDQCAAFISSEIKNATHEGIDRNDILAGLVYSICFNYVNRVKGNRPVGAKLFMQGGVCCNKAVPLAMASILGRPVVVPPEPGLMGAFGVALALAMKMRSGLLAPKKFRLAEIVDREMLHESPFVCSGGREKCDLKCPINRVRIAGKLYPFGGACARYSDALGKEDRAESGLDLVRGHNELVFEKYAPPHPAAADAKTIGISTSFLSTRFFPLYNAFFTRLGCRVVRPSRIREEAFYRQVTSMCFPAQLAMGLFDDLLDAKPDYVFMPHIQEVHVPGGIDRKRFCETCLLVQGEPFWMSQAFKDRIDSNRFLSPTLDLSGGLAKAEPSFVETARGLGLGAIEAQRAYRAAVSVQERCEAEIKDRGRRALKDLAAHPDRFALVLFGREYNAYSPLANKGIPKKFESRGQTIIPYDVLPYEDVEIDEDHREYMHWEAGQRILRAAEIVRRTDQLFGVYVTNFLCAPDSFIISYFRRVMGSKPSLTLELDEHTADAGINTRVEAFLDIVRNYREIGPSVASAGDSFLPAEIGFEKGRPVYIDSAGERFRLQDPRVALLIPSMGKLESHAFATANERFGIKAISLPVADQEALRLGRAATTGKECLPMQVTLGSLLKYLREEKKPGDRLAVFLPKSSAYCRFGQYHVLSKQVIRERRIADVAFFSPDIHDVYTALGTRWSLLMWRAMLVGDIATDVLNALRALALDPDNACRLFHDEWNGLMDVFRGGAGRFYQRLRRMAAVLAGIPLKAPYKKAPLVELTGEIFVRRDTFSNLGMADRLARKGFVVKAAHVGELLLYNNFLLTKGHLESRFNVFGRLSFTVSKIVMSVMEGKVGRIMAASGLYKAEHTDIEDLMRHKRHIVPDCVTGEHDLVLSVMLRDGLSKYCGMVSVGPFGCMQLRFTESLAVPQTGVNSKIIALRNAGKLPVVEGFDETDRIPFLTVESDGNPYPQLLDARFENFCLQAARTAERQGKVTAHLDLT